MDSQENETCLNEYEATLVYAIQNNYDNIFNLVIDKVTDVNIKVREYSGKLCLLTIAYEENNFTIMKGLIEKGADVNSISCSGKNLLLDACIKSNFRIAKLLIENGAKMNGEYKGESLLIHACKKNNLELTKFLIENGADVNYINKDEQTALLVAYEKKYFDIVDFLLANCNVDMNIHSVIMKEYIL